MKSIPVTPQLMAIFTDALMDSYEFLNECERDLSTTKSDTGAYGLLLEAIEYRKQNTAILRDLIERYKN